MGLEVRETGEGDPGGATGAGAGGGDGMDMEGAASHGQGRGGAGMEGEEGTGGSPEVSRWARYKVAVSRIVDMVKMKVLVRKAKEGFIEVKDKGAAVEGGEEGIEKEEWLQKGEAGGIEVVEEYVEKEEQQEEPTQESLNMSGCLDDNLYSFLENIGEGGKDVEA